MRCALRLSFKRALLLPFAAPAGSREAGQGPRGLRVPAAEAGR